MKKSFYCKSYVTGKVRKTKHIIFYTTYTHCFRFGFRVKILKDVVKIRLVFLNGHTSIIELPVTHYKAAIAKLKEDCLENFG